MLKICLKKQYKKHYTTIICIMHNNNYHIYIPLVEENDYIDM